MNDDDASNQDRSPRAPVVELEEAISRVKKLHAQIGRSPVKPEVACRAMGYSGLTGSSLTLLAGFSQYGLIDRSKGMLAVTPLSLRILHPTSTEQSLGAIREAALAPKIFLDLYNGYNDCSEEVLSSHLVQNGFNLDRAKRVARAYTANKSFAKLDSASAPVVQSEGKDETPKTPPPLSPPAVVPKTQTLPAFTFEDTMADYGEASSLIPKGQKMLAQYTIPLGANQATLVFTGDKLTPDDFDALVDFVQFSKRQFERAQKGVAAAKAAFASPRVEEVPPTREVRDDLATYHPGVIPGKDYAKEVLTPPE